MNPLTFIFLAFNTITPVAVLPEIVINQEQVNLTSYNLKTGNYCEVEKYYKFLAPDTLKVDFNNVCCEDIDEAFLQNYNPNDGSDESLFLMKQFPVHNTGGSAICDDDYNYLKDAVECFMDKFNDLYTQLPHNEGITIVTATDDKENSIAPE